MSTNHSRFTKYIEEHLIILIPRAENIFLFLNKKSKTHSYLCSNNLTTKGKKKLFMICDMDHDLFVLVLSTD
jgi:hypothetical protein